MTPQHRNSLLLRQHEISSFVNGFGPDTKEILDESDAILSHEFQLVYAMGTQSQLPQGQRRWIVLQCLLTRLARSTFEDVKTTVGRPDLFVNGSSELGSFPSLRVLDRFNSGPYPRLLSAALCRDLIEEPPYELRWMESVAKPLVEALMTAMTSPEFSGVQKVVQSSPLFLRNTRDILSIRGFLAYGILFHGLSRRYGVDFGLNPSLKTRMAVPFSACDTPKYRAQYCHPDVELVFTTLTYYYVGIEKDQMKSVLTSLYTLGDVARFSLDRRSKEGRFICRRAEIR